MNKATKRIGDYGGKIEAVAGRGMADLAAACDDEIRPGERDDLEGLVDIRKLNNTSI